MQPRSHLQQRLRVGHNIIALAGDLVGRLHVLVEHLLWCEVGAVRDWSWVQWASRRLGSIGAARLAQNLACWETTATAGTAGTAAAEWEPGKRRKRGAGRTSKAMGMRAGWATQVPSWPSITSRSLSARTLSITSCQSVTRDGRMVGYEGGSKQGARRVGGAGTLASSSGSSSSDGRRQRQQAPDQAKQRCPSLPHSLTLFLASSPLIGIMALMPPMAKQPRLWHVFTTSVVSAGW